MTAGPMTLPDKDAAVSVGTVRSFIGRHRRRSWVDWYVAGFTLLIVGIYGADFLASPLSRLSKSASHAAATHAAATQAVAGAGLVIGVGAGLLLLAQALGPLALSPADASWLLLTPLDRRAVLRRAALTVAVLATLAGALLGVLGLAMAGPTSGFPAAGCPDPGCSFPRSPGPGAAWRRWPPRRSPSRMTGRAPWSAPSAWRSPW